MSGALLGGLGFLAGRSWDGSNRQLVAVGIVSAGAALSFVGGRKLTRAREAMQSAIWWYNASLADSPASAPLRGEPQPALRPIRALQHQGRAGAVLRSLAGLVAGLAVSSRDTSIEWPQGVAETLAFTAAGALLGTLIGRNVMRWRAGRHPAGPTRDCQSPMTARLVSTAPDSADFPLGRTA